MVEREDQYGARAHYSKAKIYEHYDEKRFTSPSGLLFDAMEKAVLLSSVPSDHDSRILECGAGTGRFAIELAGRGYCILATDVSEGMLEHARRKVAEHALEDRVTLELCDIFDISQEDGSFDFVYSMRVLNQLAQNAHKRRAIGELARVVRPGGRLLFDIVNKWSLASLRKASWHISPSATKKILRACDMRIVRMTGRMMLSQTLLNLLPVRLARVVSAIDTGLCAVLPFLGTRVYFLAEKKPED